MHSEDWPRCPNCGNYAFEGRTTCGRAWCERVLERSESLGRIHVSGRRKPFWVVPEVVDLASFERHLDGKVKLSQTYTSLAH